MPFEGRKVVVTGGTGALGGAVVAAFVEVGVACTVPWLHEQEAERFPYRESKQVKLIGPVDLADEAAVDRLFAGVPALWASVHIAGGFAMSPVAKTNKDELMQQIDINLVSCFLCCAAATTPSVAPAKASASSTFRRVRRSNGGSAPAWPPTPRPRPRWRH